MPDLLPEPAGDRLLVEAEKMLLDMQRRFGVPAGGVETSPQGDAGDGDGLSPQCHHPGDGPEPREAAS